MPLLARNSANASVNPRHNSFIQNAGVRMASPTIQRLAASDPSQIGANDDLGYAASSQRMGTFTHNRPIPSPPPTPAPKPSEFVRIPGHIPYRMMARSLMIGQVNPSSTIHLALALPVRNQAKLTSFLQNLYNPKSPLYGKYLTPAEFTQQFGPTEQEYSEVERYAESQGLTIEHTHRNRLLLDVSGSAATVEKAFDLKLMNYRLPDGRESYAPDNNPLVPRSIAAELLGVVGLDNMTLLHPQFVKRSSLSRIAPQQIGTGPDGGMSPSDIKTAYNLSNLPLDGSGETLGLFEMDGYDSSDITQYENQFGLNAPYLQNISVDGASGVQSSDGQVEVTLDIEMMIALAPNANEIVVYQGPNSVSGTIDTYAQIADDDIANEISASWVYKETDISSYPPFYNTENNLFQQMAAQGQSMFAAAGDWGAYNGGSTLSVNDPASQPYVTGVGGTTLSVSYPGGPWSGETTWNELNIGSGAGGGGISTIWPIPIYQQSVATPGWALLSQGSTTMRNVPDVSLNSDPNTGYSIVVNGSWGVVGGTSAAAPLWAAYTALLNQQSVANGNPRYGFLNPLLYQLGQGSSYNQVFHDINDGSNNGFYPAIDGYDDATGWGSFNGINFSLISPLYLTIYPSEVIGGTPSALTVATQFPVTSQYGLNVALSSDTLSLTSMYTGVIITNGLTTSPPVIIKTSPVTTQTTVNITASYTTTNGTQIKTTGSLILDPIPVISSLVINPSEVVGGSVAKATVNLQSPAPPSGVTITLSSDTPSVASIPASVFIPGGESSSTPIIITTSSVASQSTATITASYVDSSGTHNSVSSKILVDPQPALAGISITPTSVTGGSNVTATVTLKGPAPQGGVQVSLSNNNPAVASVPASVTIPAGSSSATVTITTTSVTAPSPVTVTASYTPPNGVANVFTATFTAYPQPAVSTLSVSPSNVIGGATATATVGLNYPAPQGGIQVSLVSDNPSIASVPASVTVPGGSTSAQVSITTTTVTSPASATITASYVDVNKVSSNAQATLSIYPVPHISGITISPNEVLGGTASAATITLQSPAPPGGVTIALSSDTPSAAAPPASVTIPEGATTSSPVSIPTNAVKSTVNVNITAQYISGGKTISSSSGSLTVVAPLSQLTITPNVIFSFFGAVGEVVLPGPAPAGGANISLVSSDPSLLAAPSSVTIPAGASSATFNLVAGGTLTTTNVTITATYGLASNKISTNATVLSILYGFLPLFY